MTETQFVDLLCEYRTKFRLLAMVSTLSILVLSASLFYVESGTATYVIAVVQIVTFAAILLLSGGLIVVCERRSV
ncbi:hypothetical protein SAMN04487950_3443 [Halogranum rubrum]|uniref:Uncharacterized protein n=1 Tax=Halogranum rubrum TaxID=553466 RepID=A0A1I4GXY5_9EURY|nr:hypothetical protein [Halogranum rubrum]SFL34001.1 hypothetical protein SAMN04487950_3443 [Halogranum rubrum]